MLEHLMRTPYGSDSWFEAVTGRLGGLWRRLPRRRNSRAAIVRRLEQLERLTRGGNATYVGNNRLLTRLMIDNIMLALLVEADDRLIVPHFTMTGIYEAWATRFFLNNVKPHHHCLDIGANFGYFTCLLAQLATEGKTIGIEPQRHVYELLRDNIHINSLYSATSINAAVGAARGSLTLYRRHTRSGNTSIIKVSGDDVRYLGETAPEPFEIDAISIDDLLPEFDHRIDIIKIDVEGAEPLVFRGAQQAIAANPQVRIIMEWSREQITHAGFDPAEFVKELDRIGLKVALVQPGGPKPVTFDRLLGAPYHPGVLLTLRS
jgi:FkbM family methyltransferase